MRWGWWSVSLESRSQVGTNSAHTQVQIKQDPANNGRRPFKIDSINAPPPSPTATPFQSKRAGALACPARALARSIHPVGLSSAIDSVDSEPSNNFLPHPTPIIGYLAYARHPSHPTTHTQAASFVVHEARAPSACCRPARVVLDARGRQLGGALIVRPPRRRLCCSGASIHTIIKRTRTYARTHVCAC